MILSTKVDFEIAKSYISVYTYFGPKAQIEVGQLIIIAKHCTMLRYWVKATTGSAIPLIVQHFEEMNPHLCNTAM